MEELKLTLRLELQGEVKASYRGQAVPLRDGLLEIEATLDGPPQAIRLTGLLDGAGMIRLGPLLAGLKERPRAPARLTFALTPAALVAHAQAYAQAEDVEEWLAAGEGAALKLENYKVESVTGRSTSEAISESVDVEVAPE